MVESDPDSLLCDAWVTEGLPSEGEERNVDSDVDANISGLLMLLYNAEGHGQVLELVDELMDAGALARPLALTSMLKTLARRQMDTEAIALKDRIVRMGMPNVYHYNIILNMHAKARELDAALGVLAEMQAVGVKPTVASFAVVTEQCEKLHDSKMILVLIERMLAAEIQPTPLAFVSFVKACAKLGKFDRSIGVFARLKAAGPDHAPNLKMWVAMIRGYGSVGDIDGAVSTFEDMKSAGIKPNEIAFNAAIAACAQVQDLHRGVLFYQEMKVAEIPTGIGTYALLIELCSLSGHTAGALEVFSVALGKGHFKGAIKSVTHAYDAESTQNAIYLLRVPKAAAVEAVRYKLGRLTKRDLRMGLGIITGKGSHLAPAVAALLATEQYASLSAVVDPQNAGVILIDPVRLATWHAAQT